MVEWKTHHFAKVTNILAAVGIVFVAIYRLVDTSEKTVNQAVVSLYYLFFAILVVAAEFRLRFITNLFGFLSGQMGRGFFIFMCGSLFLSGHVDITVIIGIALMVIGALNMLVRLIKGDQFRKYRTPSAQGQAENPENPQKQPKPEKIKTPKKSKAEKAAEKATASQNDQPISDGPAIRF